MTPEKRFPLAIFSSLSPQRIRRFRLFVSGALFLAILGFLIPKAAQIQRQWMAQSMSAGSFRATGPSSVVVNNNGVLQVPSGSSVQFDWNFGGEQCFSYSSLGSPQWDNGHTYDKFIRNVTNYNENRNVINCTGSVTVTNITASQTYYISLGDTLLGKISVVVQPASGSITGIGGLSSGIRAFGPGGQVSDTNGVLQIPSGSTAFIEWNLPSAVGTCFSYSSLGSSGWDALHTYDQFVRNTLNFLQNRNGIPCTGIVSVANITSSQTFYIATNDTYVPFAKISVVVQPASGSITGIGGLSSGIRAFGPGGQVSDASGNIQVPAGSPLHIEWNITPVNGVCFSYSTLGSPNWDKSHTATSFAQGGVQNAMENRNAVQCTGIVSIPSITAAQSFTLATLSSQLGSINVSPAQPFSVGSCNGAEFDAAKGNFPSQGWVASMTVTGPISEGGTKYMRITSTPANGGAGAYVPIPRAVFQDKDWTMEIKARIINSDSGRTDLTAGLFFGVAPDGRYLTLYFDEDKFGVIKNLNWARTVSRDTTDAFHTYTMVYKKNGTGVTDDTFDVYFDGIKVLDTVTMSQIANIPSQGFEHIYVGGVSTGATGTIDVSTIRFNNNESPCTTYSVPFPRYEVFAASQKITWEEAQALCYNQKGGNLATIRNDTERDQALLAAGSAKNVWIGLNDKQAEGKYKWISGASFSKSYWDQGQPNGIGIPNNDCVLMSHDTGLTTPGLWHDVGCDGENFDTRSYLCERGQSFGSSPTGQDCSDGIDNDGDGVFDLADPGCASATDTNEYDEICVEPTILVYNMQSLPLPSSAAPKEVLELRERTYNVTYHTEFSMEELRSAFIEQFQTVWLLNGCSEADDLLSASELEALKTFREGGGNIILSVGDLSGKTAATSEACTAKVNQVAALFGVKYSGVTSEAAGCKDVNTASPFFNGVAQIYRKASSSIEITGSAGSSVTLVKNTDGKVLLGYEAAKAGVGALILLPQDGMLQKSCSDFQAYANIFGILKTRLECANHVHQCNDGINNDDEDGIDHADTGCFDDTDTTEQDDYYPLQGGACVLTATRSDGTGTLVTQCPKNYSVMGGGWYNYGVTNDSIDLSRPHEQGWECERNQFATNNNAECRAICCLDSLVETKVVTAVGSMQQHLEPVCPAGYDVTGGGMNDKTPDKDDDFIRPEGSNGWHCFDDNSTAQNSACYAICAKSKTSQPLSCVTIEQKGKQDPAVSIACPPGTLITGGGFTDNTTGEDDQDNSFPLINNGWLCQEDYQDSPNAESFCYARCCTFPQIEVKLRQTSSSSSARCGDSIITNPEKCDDGNVINLDGCSSTCQVENGWACTVPTAGSSSSANATAAIIPQEPSKGLFRWLASIFTAQTTIPADTFTATGPNGEKPNANGILRIAKGSDVTIEWNFPGKHCVAGEGNNDWYYGEGKNKNTSGNITQGASGKVVLHNRQRIESYTMECHLQPSAIWQIPLISKTIIVVFDSLDFAPPAPNTFEVIGANGARMNTNGVLTVPSGTDVIVQWNYPGNVCVPQQPPSPNDLYSMSEWMGEPVGTIYQESVGVRVIRARTQNESYRIKCDVNSNFMVLNKPTPIDQTRSLAIGPSVCGDGSKVTAEECDDGNTASGDGCSATCRIETAQSSSASCTVSNPSFCSGGNCPKVMATSGGKTYLRFEKESVTWANARTDCQAIGGDLVSINTAAEQTVIQSLASGKSGVWIGLTDSVTEGSFKWLDGSTASYTNWEASQPDNGGNGEHCGEINSSWLATNGKWNDYGCSIPNQGFICELPVNCGQSSSVANNAQASAQLSQGTAVSGPSVCTPICGDGLKLGTEQCDDGNRIDTDACNNTCRLKSSSSSSSSRSSSSSSRSSSSGRSSSSQSSSRSSLSSLRSSSSVRSSSSFRSSAGSLSSGSTLSASTLPGSAGSTAFSEGSFVGNGGDAECTDDAQCFWWQTCRNGECGVFLGAAPTLELEPLFPGMCGDGTVNTDEECDDRNLRDGDGCSNNCFLEQGFCGDGVRQRALGEQCEPTPGTCTAQCTFILLHCGDGKLDEREECDYAGRNSNLPDAACRSNCTLARCGDAIVDTRTEQCDDGNWLNGDGCSKTCTKEAGNGTLAETVTLPADSTHSGAPIHSPVGDTGPGTLAAIAAGAAGGVSWIRRKRAKAKS